MAKSTRVERKASRRANRATTRVQNRQFETIRSDFSAILWRFTKKVCTGVGARGGWRTVSPVRGELSAMESRENLLFTSMPVKGETGRRKLWQASGGWSIRLPRRSTS